MKRGKQTCRILKEIRKQIAEANDIEFVTSECQYHGECLGTCPKCESEVRYLEQQLERKRLAGKTIDILGISIGVISMTSLMSCMNVVNKEKKDDTTKKTTESNAAYIPVPRPKEIYFEGMTEKMPTFPDGQSALMEFIDKNINHNLLKECNQNGSVRIIVQFIIDKKGRVRKPQITERSSNEDPRLKKEALRVIKLMPKWNPGMQNNKPISVKFTVPIMFKLQYI